MTINAYALLVVGILLVGLFIQEAPGATDKEKKKRQFIVTACIFLFAVYGLRDAFTIGGDSTSSYLHRFQDIEQIEPIGWFTGENWGFFWLMRLVSRLTGGSYQMFIILISAFVMIVFARFLKKYSPNPLQSILYYLGMLLYPFLFSALKQSIAMAFVLLAFDGIVEKKPMKFILLVFLGSFFHFPALVFLPAYWIVKIGVGKNYLFTLAGMLIVVYLFREQLLSSMMDFYYGTEAPTKTVQFFGTKVILMILIVAIALLLRPPTSEDRIYNMLLSFMGVAVVFQTFCFYNNVFERLADYYFQFSVIFIPMVFDTRQQTKSPLSRRTEYHIKRWAPWLTCMFAIWRFLMYMQNNADIFLPYRFFFSPSD